MKLPIPGNRCFLLPLPAAVAASLLLGGVMVAPAIAFTAEAPPAHESEVSSAHTLHPTIAVLGVGSVDAEGHAAADTAHSHGDTVLRSLAEEAITKSHAFRLYSRDLMTEQTREIKMDSEGWVDPASAQKFGKSVGIESFLTVVVSNGSVRRFTGEGVSEFTVPTNGNPVTGSLYIATPGDSAALNRKNKKFTPPSQRALMQGTATIICRFTRVETGERVTESYNGIATADGQSGDERKVLAVAVQDAFNNFSLSLSKNRTQMVGNVVEIADNKLIVDIGSTDGVRKDMAFEVCETKKIGSFVSYSHICDAKVSDVEDHCTGERLFTRVSPLGVG